MSPLLRELHRASLLARAPAFAEPLRAFGFTADLCPIWGLASVEADAEFYRPSEEGVLSAIVPAYEEIDGCATIVDLVACCFATREMRTRRGVASVLGHEWIGNSCLDLAPLRVFDNALTWLRGKCLGVVVLDWNAAPSLLRDVPEIHCQSSTTAERLMHAFERPHPYSPVLIPQGERK